MLQWRTLMRRRYRRCVWTTRWCVALCAVVALASSSCSLVFQQHLPDRAAGDVATRAADGRTRVIREPRCSTSRALPFIDTVALASDVVTGALTASRESDTGKTIGGIALAAAMIHLASADNGYRRAAECKRAKAAALSGAALSGGAPLAPK
jgi:hypothetical protein